MTDGDLQAIKERAAKATPGPWAGPRITDLWPPGWVGVYEGDGTGDVIPGSIIGVTSHATDNEDLQDANAKFIAHAREDIPMLVEEVERLQEELEGIREAVRGAVREVAELL